MAVNVDEGKDDVMLDGDDEDENDEEDGDVDVDEEVGDEDVDGGMAMDDVGCEVMEAIRIFQVLFAHLIPALVLFLLVSLVLLRA